MWPFDTKAKKAFKATQERDACLKTLMSCAAAGDRQGMNTPLLTLLDHHLDAPSLPQSLVGAVDSMAKDHLKAALEISLYLVAPRNFDDKEKNEAFRKIQLAVAENAFALMSRQMSEMSDCAFGVAGVTMLAGTVASAADPGSDMERRAIGQWQQAMAVLVDKSLDNYALAAACNAVCGRRNSQALADTAITTFETALVGLARNDKPAAAALAQSFEQKCREFDAPQRQRAAAFVAALK